MFLFSLFRRCDHGGALDFHARRDFGVRQNGKIGERAFKEPAEREPYLRRTKDKRLMAVREELLDVSR